jgi:sugar phosphate isomerase/epimerase
LRIRVETAAAAGWAGIGLVHADLVAFQERQPISDLALLLADNGMEFVELEFLGDWWTTGARRQASDLVRADLLDAAEQLGALTVKVGADMAEGGPDPQRFRDELDALATQAADRGTRVALEPMPFSTNVRTLDEGVGLLQEIGNPAAGLCVDIWHVFRAGTPYSRVARLPPELVFVVELDDGAAIARGSLWDDTVDRRLYPGRGDFAVPEFIDAVQATGFAGPWGVEIISAEHRALPIEESLPRLAAEVRHCFPSA